MRRSLLDGLGLSQGLNVLIGGIPLDPEVVDALDEVGVTLPAILVLPAPHFQLWFRI